MRITQIVPQKNDPNRASVFIDGLFSFGASWEIVSRENLSEGREITQEEAKRLKAADLLLEAKKKAFRHLAFRSHSKKELTEKLKCSPKLKESAGEAVDELEEKGYVDDRAFAEEYARHLLSKLWGQNKIIYELKQKGIETKTIEETLEKLFLDETKRAKALLLKKFPKGIPDKKEKSRAMALLYRYGYSYEDIRPLINEDEE